MGLPGCQARTDILTETYPEDQAKIRRVLDDLHDAIQKKDLARVEALHLYGPQVHEVRHESEPVARPDATASREIERRAVLRKAEVGVTSREMKVDVFGDVAVTTGVLAYRVKLRDQA